MSVATTAPVEPTAPAPTPTRIHLLPVPQYEPPYDDELTADQVRYRALVEQSAAAEPRPESCGKAFGTPLELRVLALEKQD